MKIIKANVSMVNTSGIDENSIIAHIEKCGRVCYKSEDLITPESGRKFIGNIIKRGHTSVLEHGNLIFTVSPNVYIVMRGMTDIFARNGIRTYLRFSDYEGKDYKSRNVVSGNIRAWRDFFKAWKDLGLKIPVGVANSFTDYTMLLGDIITPDAIDYDRPCLPMTAVSSKDLTDREQYIHCTQTVKFVVDRGISHELVRHRTISPSQESTRYCNYSNAKFGGEITVIEPCFLKKDTIPYRLWAESCVMDEYRYFILLDIGFTPQEARAVLPTSLKTEVVMTGTYAEWRKFLKLRTENGVHPQMREVADKLLNTMAACYQQWYGDLKAE